MMKLRSRSDVSWSIPTAIYDREDGTIVMIDNHSEMRVLLAGAKVWHFITLHSSPEEFNEFLKSCPCSIDVGKSGVCGLPYDHSGGHKAMKVQQ